MGLLDSLLGAALGGGNQQQNTAVQLVLQLIEKSGGVGNLGYLHYMVEISSSSKSSSPPYNSTKVGI